MMVERFSNISVNLGKHGSTYFLFAPLGGLVAYTFLFHVTKPSTLLFASSTEKLISFFTLVFFAFAVAAVVSISLSAAQAAGNVLVRKIANRAELVLFAAMSTVLALVMAENFTYTMFRVGIKNTDATVAKLVCLAVTVGVFFFFLKISANFRRVIANCRVPVANGIIAVAGLITLFNLSGNINALASLEASFPKRFNIVIVSSDGINAERMSVYGGHRRTTPFLDSIKDEFLFARSAFTNNGHTTGSIVSLLTGMLPTRTKVVFPPDSLTGENSYRSLPRLLRMQGYYANNIAVPHYSDASEQNMLEAFDFNNNRSMISSSFPIKFSYKTTNWLFDRLLSETTGLVKDVLWLEEMPNPYAQVDGKKRGMRYGFNDMYRLQGLLSDLNRSDRPFFINSHFLGTHGPYFNPGVVRFSRGSKDKGKVWSMDHYDDAILTFDGYVKRIYDRLKSKGLLEKTILVITSDHGRANESRQKVPLMIRFPNQDYAGTVINENVQSIDVAPTLVDYLGGRKPSWMEGQSLIAGPVPADRNIFSASVAKIFFASSIGVIGEPTGRYGSMDFFYLMRCDKTYKLDLRTSKLEALDAPQPQKACSSDQELSPAAAKDVMMQHLHERYG